jgi:uncharacterized membrane protein YkgB
MTRNMGTGDRAVRTLIAIVIIALVATGRVGGVLAIVLGIVAVAFLATSASGWCPAYLPFGLSTHRSATGTPKV